MVFFAALIAGVIQTVTGFGAGVVMMLILPYFFDMVVAPGISSAIGTGITYALLWKFRKHVDFKQILVPAVVYIPCSFLVIHFVRKMDMNFLTLVFGVFLIVLAIYFFAFSNRISFRANWFSAIVCAAISGVSSGLFGIGGPLMAIYFVSATRSKEEYSGTIQGLFCLTGTANLLMRAGQGIYTVDLIPLTLFGFVAINLGKILGLKIVSSLDSNLMKKVVYAFVGVSGVVTVLKCLI